ncbi:hypothetical protein AMECASPLE_014268 [Ameca splendens]|uniref:Uncharacterized protein n=1 Tax=Ameca splendens TaxID=208324 RepID=A0ABV0ZP13_9TELE
MPFSVDDCRVSCWCPDIPSCQITGAALPSAGSLKSLQDNNSVTPESLIPLQHASNYLSINFKGRCTGSKPVLSSFINFFLFNPQAFIRESVLSTCGTLQALLQLIIHDKIHAVPCKSIYAP